MTPDFPTLQTARLQLREIVPADVPALFAIHGDAEAMKWFGSDTLADEAAALALVERFAGWRAAGTGVRWGIVAEPGGPLIGSCGLFGWHRAWQKCVLGYELHPAWQRQGFLREALLAVLPWGFEHMALNRVEAQVHPLNASSIRALERLGFQREGRLRQAGYWNGRHHDLLQYGLLRADWAGGAGR